MLGIFPPHDWYIEEDNRLIYSGAELLLLVLPTYLAQVETRTSILLLILVSILCWLILIFYVSLVLSIFCGRGSLNLRAVVGRFAFAFVDVVAATDPPAAFIAIITTTTARVRDNDNVKPPFFIINIVCPSPYRFPLLQFILIQTTYLLQLLSSSSQISKLFVKLNTTLS